MQGHLAELRSNPLEFPDGVRPKGSNIHSICARPTIDELATILYQEADTKSSPYDCVCGSIAHAYAQLKGLRIGPAS